MQVKVTIVILNWNGKHWLEKFLPFVVKTTYRPLEILVVDNGSTDDSVPFLKEEFPQIRLLEFEQNYGFTDGHNLALKHIDSPYIALLNSDVEVTPNWLEPLVMMMEQDMSIASVQPKIIAYHDRISFEYAGAAGGFLDHHYYPFCRGRIFDEVEKDKGQYDDPREVFWATGACSLLRQSVIEHIGLFESSFFAHMEEIDFCWRAKNFGYKIMVQPQSTVYHVGGGALPKGNPQKTYLNVRNSLGMMYKNLPSKELFPKIFSRLLLDGVWGIRSFLTWDFATIGAIIRAHFDFYARIPFWQKRRNEIYQHRSQQKHSSGFYSKSIVWQHFIKGKKKWKDLGMMR